MSVPATADPRVRRTELVISMVLRVGVVASLVLIVAGLVVSFVHHPDYRTSSVVRQAVITGKTSYPHSAGSVISALAAGQGRGIVTLGLLVLLLTPIARVAVSVLIYSFQRDFLFVAVTSFVLVVLLLSFVIGRAIA